MGAVGWPHVVERGSIPDGLKDDHREAHRVRLWTCSSIEVQTSEWIDWADRVRDVALFGIASSGTVSENRWKATYSMVRTVDIDPVPAPMGPISSVTRLRELGERY